MLPISEINCSSVFKIDCQRAPDTKQSTKSTTNQKPPQILLKDSSMNKPNPNLKTHPEIPIPKIQ